MGHPKAELHLHIEGTLEPEMMFMFARRNGVDLPFESVAAVKAAYEFSDLQSFLDIYYAGAAALQTEDDFAELAGAYVQKAAADGVTRAEVFFDPQTHTDRGVAFDTVVNGLERGLGSAGRRLGVSTGLIMCFLRHLDEAAAIRTLELAAPHAQRLIGVGLDSSEVGNPPSKFARVFEEARGLGLRVVAHAGEEAGPEYVWEALDVLGAERIDHGVRAIEDDRLMERLVTERIPLTMCPLSNLALRVVDTLDDHPLPEFVQRGALVTINSDDPAYFGGYVGANYDAVQKVFGFDEVTMEQLAANSLEAAFD